MRQLPSTHTAIGRVSTWAARAAQVLTLPMAVCVDGNCLMGPCRGRVDAEMHSFQAWALDVVA